MKHRLRVPHVHTPDDGRGRRRVFVDGSEVLGVFLADTQRGLVRYYPQPPRLDKHGKRVIQRTRRGRVTVESIP